MKDPEKQVTFTCQNCGHEVTRPRSWGKGYFKYCSNTCAQRHTKTKQHIVVDDAVVLDSSWEALFWGVCAFVKLPIERYNRVHGVERPGGGWYAPDFWLPSLGLAVEVKGVEDDDDTDKWDAWREQYGPLVVLSRTHLAQLSPAWSVQQLSAYLSACPTLAVSH